VCTRPAPPVPPFPPPTRSRIVEMAESQNREVAQRSRLSQRNNVNDRDEQEPRAYGIIYRRPGESREFLAADSFVDETRGGGARECYRIRARDFRSAGPHPRCIEFQPPANSSSFGDFLLPGSFSYVSLSSSLPFFSIGEVSRGETRSLYERDSSTSTSSRRLFRNRQLVRSNRLEFCTLGVRGELRASVSQND